MNKVKYAFNKSVLCPTRLADYVILGRIKQWTYFFFFWLCCAACGILVPWPGIEPTSPAVEAWSLNRWTAREAPNSGCICRFLYCRFSHLVPSENISLVWHMFTFKWENINWRQWCEFLFTDKTGTTWTLFFFFQLYWPCCDLSFLICEMEQWDRTISTLSSISICLESADQGFLFLYVSMIYDLQLWVETSFLWSLCPVQPELCLARWSPSTSQPLEGLSVQWAWGYHSSF